MIEIENMSKIYDLGVTKLKALDSVSFKIERGEFVTIMGPSGSGKSTLLHILGILDLPSEGSYKLEGNEISSLPDKELSRIRNEYFGFVFQSFNLLPEFSAMDNVIMPLTYAGMNPKRRKERAKELLVQMGLEARMYHYPNMLSGGEQQRVAIARALANDPGLLLADEPTGNLPSNTGMEILDLIRRLNEEGLSVVLVTHDERIGASGKRTLRLKDGKILRDETVTERFDPGTLVTGKEPV